MHPEVRRDEPGDCPICGMPLEPRIEKDAIAADGPRLLAVPKSAVLRTGERALVYVMTRPPQWEQQGGEWVEVAPAAFAAREVQVGPRAGEWLPILAGLEEGERVVTRGNFLIDSQMELLGKASLLHPEGGVTSADPHAGH
jgi:Cu(I)/Ag(I) efflux system membrane fusion protein